jgi:amino acid adenylation domain-containing protein
MNSSVQASSETATRLSNAYLALKKAEARLREIRESANEPIAVVGAACRLPGGVRNPGQLWALLRDQIDPITSAAGRKGGSEKPESYWGGFVDGVDRFDAEFFNISRKEAELMDPQQRILLEETWNAIEDSGHAPSDFSNNVCGVYVGAMNADYRELLREANQAADSHELFGNALSSLAGRLSYFLNLKGPSLVVDTACSSSAVALHLACAALKTGEIDFALAAGITIHLSRREHGLMAHAGMLARDGRCKTFDDSADGFVPSDGVVVFVLRRLRDAVRDGDNVYGVIRRCAVNQDGKTNGLTAPNPLAQSALQTQIFSKSGVSPESVTYVEAHGTGTKLGDPIELKALTDSFRKSSERNGFCAIGSAKTNVGHTCAAAGLVGLLKVLLALRHEKIPGSLHFQEPNQHIPFGQTPFFLHDHLRPWPHEEGQPRRALINAFGHSGTNCVMLVEEAPIVAGGMKAAAPRPLLFPFSAKDDPALTRRLRDFTAWLDEEGAEVSLEDVSFTLVSGRAFFATRAVVMARSVEELRAVLTQMIATRVAGGTPAFPRHDGAPPALSELAEQFLRGEDLDGSALFPESRRRVSLPTYPFAGERYWIEAPLLPRSDQNALHPLLDANISSLAGVAFEKELHAEEFFLRDHRVASQIVFPGVAYLEMARASGEIAADKPVRKITDVTWGRPVILSADSHRIRIDLKPAGLAVSYEVRSADSESSASSSGSIHSFGKVSFESMEQPPPISNEAVAAIRARCPTRLEKREIYERLTSIGFGYGPTFQVTEELWTGENETLARLRAPSEALTKQIQVGSSTRTSDDDADVPHRFFLHPSLLDGALRAIMAAQFERHREFFEKPFVPFAMAEMRLFHPLPETCLVHGRSVFNADLGTLTIDVTLFDDAGTVLTEIERFTTRAFLKSARVGEKKNREVLFYRPAWIDETSLQPVLDVEGPVLVFDRGETVARELERSFPTLKKQGVSLVKPGATFRVISDSVFEIDPCSANDCAALFGRLKELGRFPKRILHLWNAGENSSLNLPNDASLAASLEHGVYSLLRLFQAVTRVDSTANVRCLFAFSNSGDGAPEFEMVGGLQRAFTTVNHRFQNTLVEFSASADASQLVSAVVREFGSHAGGPSKHVRYSGDARTVRTWLPLEEKETPGPISVRAADSSLPMTTGPFWITGGLGGLGVIVARFLAVRGAKKIALSGRSPLDANKSATLETLRQSLHGVEIEYFSGDISESISTTKIARQIRERFGPLRGVIHSAGLDAFVPLMDVDAAGFESVLRPKVHGTIQLDLATQNDPLEFFILFSSIAAEVGDFGAGSYAAGNRFLDAFAQQRDRLRAAGNRTGRTLSINWPLWREGGMQLGEERSSLYFDYSGMDALETEEGIEVLSRAWQSGETQVLVAAGDPEKIERILLGSLPSESPATAIADGAAARVVSSGALMSYLRNHLSEVIKMPAHRINPATTLETYGVDSVMIMELNQRLGRDFDGLPGTLFFECKTLAEAAAYLDQKQSKRVADLFGAPSHVDRPIDSSPQNPGATERLVPAKKQEAASPGPENLATAPSETDAIAIIGIAGRYPQSANVAEFWRHLDAGKNAITEIPRDRWDWREFYSPDAQEPGKTNSKWGAFIDDADRFDAAFFNIAPAEARRMDPQSRWLLQTVWATLENSGYTREQLNFCAGRARRFVGVFAGAMWGDYRLHGAAEGNSEGVVTSADFSSLANRVSHFFDFRGPSLAIDGACSSSLAALHLACESLKRGECEHAIAAGVNLILHPNRYLKLSEMGLLAADGQCRVLDPQGAGYVPGEGVGAVLLKPLSAAMRDGDTIHAIIKGSGLSHAGRTSGYTVPDAGAQAELITRVFDRAGISPQTIGCVELAAVGAAVADSLEIAGLEKAFKPITSEAGFCALGSLKPRFGHMESTSGLAALTKVIWQFRRKIIPAFGGETFQIPEGLRDTAFFVPRESQAWTAPAGTPLRAAISAFGAGGAMAHVIVEAPPAMHREPRGESGPQIIVLSGKDTGRLRASAENLLAFLKEASTTGQILSATEIAWTLQSGREAMDERLAFVARDLKELEEKLGAFLSGEFRGAAVFRANAAHPNAAVSLLTEDLAGREMTRLLLDRGELDHLAELWTLGVEMDWTSFQRGTPPRKIELPSYPFAGERYWFTSRESATVGSPMSSSQSSPRADRFNNPDLRVESSNLRSVLRGVLAKVLEIREEALTDDAPLRNYGFDSLYAMRAANRLNRILNREIPVPLLLEHESLAALARELEKETPHQAVDEKPAAIISEREQETVRASNPRQLAPFPLSETQRALWSLAQRQPASAAYHVPLALEWPGPLDRERFRIALKHALKTHEGLRTAIRFDRDQPKQSILEQDGADIFEEDLSACSPAEVREHIQSLIAQPFDFENGPLWRMHWLKKPDGAILPLFVAHHIVFDGQSALLFLETLWQTYRDGEKESGSAGAMVATGRDFVDWERRYLNSVRAKRDREYWIRVLSGFDREGSLFPERPTDTASASAKFSLGGAVYLELVREEFDVVKRTAVELEISVHTLMLAAFQILLAARCSRRSILVGIPADIRPEAEFEETVGCFINMLPITSEIHPESTAGDFIGRLRSHLLEACEHRFFAFNRLAAERSAGPGASRLSSALHREPGRSPAPIRLEAAFYYHSWLRKWPADAPRILPRIHQQGEFPLTVEAIENVETCEIRFKYNSPFLDETRVESMARDYAELLKQISHDPSKTIETLIADTRRPDAAIAGPKPEPIPRICVHDLFADRARQTPDSIALIFGDQKLTYRELDLKATQLARFLKQRLGIGRDKLVGILVPRSVEMVVALLGVWKTGGAYVPLDPHFPKDRLEYIIEDAGIQLLLSAASVDLRFDGTERVEMDRQWGEIESIPEGPNGVHANPEDLAYVIFTSGSTGKPKGVEIRHRSLTNFMLSMARSPGCGPDDRVLALTTISFDIAALEIYLPLTVGGAVELLPDTIARDGLRLKEYLEKSEATLVQATPATWEMLLAANLGPIPRVKALCGGEAWNERLAARLLERTREVWNMYGPTETTVWSSIQRVLPENKVRLGDPIANTRFYVLDETLSPVPRGEVGELYIAGDGLARGYRNRPELTREKFVPDPFHENQFMYRTGDLVRYV